MAQRRSRNRRLSARKTSNVSGFLNDDTNIYDGNDPLWFDRTAIRSSTSIALTRNDSSILNPDSTVDVSKMSPNWHKNLTQSNCSKLMEQAVQRNISEQNEVQSDSSRADPTTESESEHESQKRRANFRAHQAKSNKSEKSNIFLKALEETTESHTRNLKNYTTAQESESEHEYEKKRTRFRSQLKKGDKSEKSNIFLRVLEETTGSHTRTLTAQTSKGHESESSHDESESSPTLRPKYFQTPNTSAKLLTAEQISEIDENKSSHDESTSNRRLRPKLFQTPNDKNAVSQIKSSRNSLQQSFRKSTSKSELEKSLNDKSANGEKSNVITNDQKEIENPSSSEIFEGNRSQVNDESDEENIYDGSFNRNEMSNNESQRKSLKRKLESNQSQKFSAVTGGSNISQALQLNDESDEENIFDGSFNRNEISKNKSQSKSPMAKGINNKSQGDHDSEISHKLRNKNSSNITNALQKNISRKRTSAMNEVQNTSKTLERELHKTLNDSKSLTKSRESHTQNISQANNSTTVHNSDEENSTMPRYIRRTQSRLFQKSQRIDNEEILNNESSRLKSNKTQDSNISQNSPSLRKRQSHATSTGNVIETRESDEENSTMPKYIRRTKSRLFQKSQISNSENVFNEGLSPNILSKNSEIEASQNSKQTSKSMLRDAMNRSTSLMKPRVILTRIHNPDSSTESQKENRLAVSRTKNSPSKSKRQITTMDGNYIDESSPNKSKQQKIHNLEDSQGGISQSRHLLRKSRNQSINAPKNQGGLSPAKTSLRKSRNQTINMTGNQSNVSHTKNSLKKSSNQTVSVTENQSNVSHTKNSPKKSRGQRVSLEENQSNVSHSKNSQNKPKQQAVTEKDDEADVSRGKNSVRKSKSQAAIEASDNNSEHTVSLPEESNGQGVSKDGNTGTKTATANERSRSNSHSSVETSSDRTPQQQQDQGELTDSSALPSDELYHTPNPAQSTLKFSGKPLRRLSQFSFRGWEQESIIAPIGPQPALAAAMRTRTIAEEPTEASPHHPAETDPQSPPEALTRPAAEASPRHATKVSPRHSTRVSSRHSAVESPQNAAEVPSRHLAEASSRHSEKASIQETPKASSRQPAVDAQDDDDDIDVMNCSDASHVSDYPLLTRQLNEIPYENERTTDNEDTAPSISANMWKADEQVDQNVSTIDKSAWAEVKKKTDALKMMMEAQMKRERERRLQEERQRQQTAAKLKRIMAQKAAEKRKREKKPVDEAFLVDGKVYKQPKLPRPQKWATDRLYKHLWKCMEPRYGLRTRVKSEEFVLKLANFAKIFERRKKYENYEAELEDLQHIMAKLNIITTRYDFYRFAWDFMPYSFRVKVRPMMMPGNVRNIPYNPELTNKPILASNNNNNKDNSESESERGSNQVASQPDSDSE